MKYKFNRCDPYHGTAMTYFPNIVIDVLSKTALRMAIGSHRPVEIIRQQWSDNMNNKLDVKNNSWVCPYCELTCDELDIKNTIKALGARTVEVHKKFVR